MPGDISKSLLAKARDRIEDNRRTIIKSDGKIYAEMTDAQELFMRQYKTSKRDFKISLTPGTFAYNINARFFEILSIRYFKATTVQDNNLHKGCEIYDTCRIDLPEYNDAIPDHSTYRPLSITLNSLQEIGTGDWIIITGNIAPARIIPGDNYYETELLPADPTDFTTDIIDDTHDPLIEAMYHNLLVDYALKDFKNRDEKFKDFKDLAMIIAEVQVLAQTTHRPNKARTINVGNQFWQ